MSFLPLLRRIVLLTLLAASGAGARPLRDVVVVDLHPEAVLSGAVVRLSDLAGIESDDLRLKRALEGMTLGSVPMVGHVEQLSRAELEDALRRQILPAAAAIDWHGAASVRIRTRSHRIDEAALVDTAKRYLAEALAPQHAVLELSLAATLADIEVPAGAVDYRARPVEHPHLHARMPVWVDVLVDGVVYRSVVVPLAVVARRPVYVARHPMAAGSVMAPADFERVTADVANLPGETVEVDMSGEIRLRQELAQGDILLRKAMTPRDMVMRGDRVRLITAGGGIVIETSAYAQADAALGTVVNVRPEQGSEAVAARVVAQGMVQVDGR